MFAPTFLNVFFIYLLYFQLCVLNLKKHMKTKNNHEV